MNSTTMTIFWNVLENGMSQANMKLIQTMGPGTAFIINDLFSQGVINDYSDDGWILFNREWIPYSTFLERYHNQDEFTF